MLAMHKTENPSMFDNQRLLQKFEQFIKMMTDSKPMIRKKAPIKELTFSLDDWLKDKQLDCSNPLFYSTSSYHLPITFSQSNHSVSKRQLHKLPTVH
jgi:hypothetical protein